MRTLLIAAASVLAITTSATANWFADKECNGYKLVEIATWAPDGSKIASRWVPASGCINLAAGKQSADPADPAERDDGPPEPDNDPTDK